MQVSPLKGYRQPGFPNRTVLDAHPELLRLVPKRWRKNPVVLAALAGVCTLSMTYWAQSKGVKGTLTRIAPIFQHGEGRGAFGCVAVNPPVVLSEADGREVIVEEAKRAGIVFTADATKVTGVKIPTIDFSKKDFSRKLVPKPMTVTLDGADKKRAISYEYVSTEDIDTWKSDPMYGSTVQDYQTREIAKAVQKGLAKSRVRGAVGVFYDPMQRMPEGQYGINRISENKQSQDNVIVQDTVDAREQLRAQVRDFIKWLKTQGVI